MKKTARRRFEINPDPTFELIFLELSELEIKEVVMAARAGADLGPELVSPGRRLSFYFPRAPL